MRDDRADTLQPVFLEPRNDHWEIHVPERLSMDEQRDYRLVPRATAERLENVIYCEDCFPADRTGDRG